jgi:hypothetical protein
MLTIRDQYPEYQHWQAEEYKIINDHVVRFSDICVYEFTMGDVEDPDLYAAGPILDWQKSPAGEFVMAHAVGQPYWLRQADYSSYGYRYRIIARLSEQNQTFFRLKFQ